MLVNRKESLKRNEKKKIESLDNLSMIHYRLIGLQNILTCLLPNDLCNDGIHDVKGGRELLDESHKEGYCLNT